MDEEDITTLLIVLASICLFGLSGWVLFELGIYLHGLNDW